jgi:SPX domain protein involved in polyphosphate accumulation
MITREQKERIVQLLQEHMTPDKYGRTTIRNIYFDTDNYRLIRASIEKPVYKEKLRIRSYRQATPDSDVFVELKKKYKSVVYKRRLSMKESDAIHWARGEQYQHQNTQIEKELEYFLKYYGNLHPTVFLSYDREAYESKYDDDFRVTFDDNILCRTSDLSLEIPPYGDPILEDGFVLMELKCAGAIPLWMTALLSAEQIYKTSFSKYGTAYKTLILPKLLQKQQNTQEDLLYDT